MKDAVNVISLTGIVKVIATNGVERILRVGDQIYVNEQIVTGDAATITIEFADDSMMDLGSNVQFILAGEMLRSDVDTKLEDTLTEKEEIQVTQTVLLQDENFDPTVELEAPAAGATGEASDGGGFSFIQVEHVESRATPVAGFETTETGGVGFAEIIVPELILEPRQIQSAGDALSSLPDGGSIPPDAFIFTLNDQKVVDEVPILNDGDPTKWLGYRIEPAAEDTVTLVNIKGFPENVDPSESDWFFGFFPEVFVEGGADYFVNFKNPEGLEGPVKSADGTTWDVPFEVTGAMPGESIVFITRVIPLSNVADNVHLEIETTVENSSGNLFTSSKFGDVGIILFDQSQELFSSASSTVGLVGTETSSITALPINSFIPQDVDILPVDVLA